MIVIRRTRGGAYIIVEMDGTVLKEKVVAFRVIPHCARYKITLPEDIHDLIDLNAEQLETMVEDISEETGQSKTDLIFDNIPHLRLPKEGESIVLEDTDNGDDSEGDDYTGDFEEV